jgi:hypothetical protein
LSEQAAAIREALSREEFDKAKPLWDEYAAQLHTAILNGRATPAMLSEMGELVDWARLTVQAVRTGATAQLNCLYAVKAYDEHPGATPNEHFRISF